jgi:hypothetical protein
MFHRNTRQQETNMNRTSRVFRNAVLAVTLLTVLPLTVSAMNRKVLDPA